MEIIEQFLQKHRKPILIIIALIIAGFIGYNIAVLISRIGKLPVTVMYAPFDAEVKINGKAYRITKIIKFTTLRQVITKLKLTVNISKR